MVQPIGYGRYTSGCAGAAICEPGEDTVVAKKPRLGGPVQAARVLQVSRAQFYRLLQDGRLPPPSYALGPRSPRWNLEELANLVITPHANGAATAADDAGLPPAPRRARSSIEAMAT